MSVSGADQSAALLHEVREEAVERALAALDLVTKVSLLAGRDVWSLPAVPAIGLASVVMSDGPIGVRGSVWTAGDPSVALPSPTALAATWDVALARRAGRLLGQECRRKSVHVLLAPTVNLHRSPLGGRHFEAYSEDPLLTAAIGAGYVTGLQETGVAATVKHFVANDSETDRFIVDVRVSERALRELYLAPFETIVTEAGAWAVMAAYNGVNGFTMTEHAELQRTVLKQEWGFDGVIVSDWTAARSTEQTVQGGLDVAMPGVGNPWGDRLVDAIRSGAVAAEQVDDQVRRVLRLAARVGALNGVPPAVAETDRPAPLDGDRVAREVAARSFVLARNTDDVLPLAPARLRRVALIGAAARAARVLGGGSAEVVAAHIVSPLDGLTAALPSTVDLVYAVGADPELYLPPAGGPQWTTTMGETGLTVTFRSADGAALYTSTLASGQARWFGELPGAMTPSLVASIEVAGRLTPESGGAHEVGLRGIGLFSLTVDGEMFFDGGLEPLSADPGEALLRAPERRFAVSLAPGKPVDVSLTYQVFLADDSVTFVSATLGHREPLAAADVLMDEAVAIATDADVAVVVVATTLDVESEGFDRTSLALPGRQDELVARVAAANPRTVVVVNTGSPVLMPWADDVAAILLTWFPGQEAGAALADVLLGAAEPGGRLPTTWPRRIEDVPVLDTTPVDGRLTYDEDVFIGYRAWDQSEAAPLFPFGHGLGYTTWSYQSIIVLPGSGSELGQVEVTLTNTGRRPGREVVQLYLTPQRSAPALPSGPAALPRPVRWLAGFAVAEAEPEESVTVRIPLPLRSVQVWDGGWHTVPGSYTVEAAHSIGERRVGTTITV